MLLLGLNALRKFRLFESRIILNFLATEDVDSLENKRKVYVFVNKLFHHSNRNRLEQNNKFGYFNIKPVL